MRKAGHDILSTSSDLSRLDLVPSQGAHTSVW